MKRIAIVGMSPAHRHLAPFDDPTVEIWTLNQSYWNAQKKRPSEWLKRWDLLFQIHDDATVRHKTNPNHPGHFQWLTEQTKPLLMQREWDEIPASVVYPKDDIEKHLGFQIWRGDVKMFDPYNSDSQTYYTSTFPYMQAYAIYCIETKIEYEPHIEVWGIDAVSRAEYGYQKPSIEFWMGVAAGRNITLTIPDNCQLLNSLEYGYEVSQLISRDTLERHIALREKQAEEWGRRAKELAAPLEKLRDENKAIPEDDSDEYFKAEAYLGLYQGAVLMLQDAENEMSDRPHLHYQRFDLRRAEFEKHVEDAKSRANQAHALMMDRIFKAKKVNKKSRERLMAEANRFGAQVDQAMKEANAFYGGMQACVAIMDEADGMGGPGEFSHFLTTMRKLRRK